jgi:hypothetical protein
MRLFPVVTLALMLAAGAARARTTSPTASTDASATTKAAEENKWSFSLSAYAYLLPHDHDYVQPTFTADRDRLHFEARYNYEDLDTTSVWLGYNLSIGDELKVDFTPMIGGVFGRTHGVAPGYELTLGWRRIELYSELEYVIDSDDSSESFLYTWTELTYAFTDWLRAGVVIQRTKAYEADVDIQRGLMAGVTYNSLDFTVHVLNPDEDPIFVLGIGYEF